MPENYYTTDHIPYYITPDPTANELTLLPDTVEIIGTTYSYSPAIGEISK